MTPPRPFASLAEFVDGLAADRPTRPALQMGDRAYTREDVVQRARQLAMGWQAAGYTPGTSIGIVGDSGPAFVLALFSVARAGLVPLLLDPRLTPGELALVIERARPRALACCGSSVATTPALPQYPFDGHGCAILAHLARASLLVHQSYPRCPDPAGPDIAGAPALMLVTSGTAGTPRVVALSAGNLSANITAAWIAHARGGTPEAFLSLLPLTHAFELVMGVLGPLWCGASIVFPESRNPNHVRRVLTSGAVTHLNVVPAVLQMLVAELREAGGPLEALTTLRGLRSIVCGGAPMAPEMAKRAIRHGAPLWLGYGLTEASPSVAVGRVDELPEGSTGRALPGVELRIDERTAELLVRGPNVMLGYVGDPHATAQVIADGWLRTGDLARIDSDGYLFILGRLGDTIVTAAGLKLQPADIEDAYRSPLFAERCAVGVPDAAGGARPHLVVVPAGRTDERTLETEFRRLSAMAGSRQAFGLTVLTTPLPRTRTLKVRRDLVRQAALVEMEAHRVTR